MMNGDTEIDTAVDTAVRATNNVAIFETDVQPADNGAAFESEWNQIESGSDASGQDGQRTPENKKMMLKLKKPSYRWTLIILGTLASALLIMVICIAATKFGGPTVETSDANEADAGGITVRPTTLPTATPLDESDPQVADPTIADPTIMDPVGTEPADTDQMGDVTTPDVEPTSSMPTSAPNKPNLRTSAPTATPTGQISSPNESNLTNGRPTLSPTTLPTKSPTQPADDEDDADVGEVTYVPGDLSVEFRGVKLSTGLSGARIAKTGNRVQLKNDSKSSIDYGQKPETAVVFNDPNTDGGWIYVVNFDKGDSNGGVGALSFDSDGVAIKYEMVLKDTTQNTGGGASPWGTFISCENEEDGQIWEVSPTGSTKAKKTILGQNGGSYKGVTFDNRNDKPIFFIAASDPKSFLMRYVPSDATMAGCVEDPAFCVLHEEGGKFEYLIMNPAEGNDSVGTVSWSESSTLGHISSQDHFQDVAGIEFRGRFLYVLSEEQKELFVVNTDTLSYKKESTDDALDGKPSEIVHILNNNRRLIMSKDEQPILYLTETNDDASAIYGRTKKGDYVVIAEDDEERGDAVGLAFSPDRRHLYFSLKDTGELFDLTRDDGKSFDEASLDIEFRK